MNKVVHLNAGLLPGFYFCGEFLHYGFKLFWKFQIFSVNSKKFCQTFKTHKIDKKKSLVASSFLSSFHFLSNVLQIYYNPFFMWDKMEGMSQNLKGPVTPTYQWLASPSHREQPLQGTSFTNTVNAQQLQQPPMCQLSSAGHTPDSGRKGL
jgi:hypothetical protein